MEPSAVLPPSTSTRVRLLKLLLSPRILTRPCMVRKRAISTPGTDRRASHRVWDPEVRSSSPLTT